MKEILRIHCEILKVTAAWPDMRLGRASFSQIFVNECHIYCIYTK
jgi:hypothetical protein